MWGEPWINLLMEAADAPRWVKGRKPAPVINSKEELEKVLGKSQKEKVESQK
ncbi:hypothetical protein [Maribellus mangrovi]|uniref:hypothetical protein n=1 Tax=Maribellus mangrovi TaxID=3133146 RepID=UPI0030ED5624